MKKFSHITTATGTITALLMLLLLPATAMSDDKGQSSQQATSAAVEQLPSGKQLDTQKAKTLLLQMLDQLDAHFQKALQKASKLKKLSTTADTDVASTINNYLSQIQTFKTQAAQAQTKAEIKQIAQQVHQLIVSAKVDVKKNISHRSEVRLRKKMRSIECSNLTNGGCLLQVLPATRHGSGKS